MFVVLDPGVNVNPASCDQTDELFEKLIVVPAVIVPAVNVIVLDAPVTLSVVGQVYVPDDTARFPVIVVVVPPVKVPPDTVALPVTFNVVGDVKLKPETSKLLLHVTVVGPLQVNPEAVFAQVKL